jgi:hypothetical protein
LLNGSTVILLILAASLICHNKPFFLLKMERSQKILNFRNDFIFGVVTKDTGENFIVFRARLPKTRQTIRLQRLWRR